MDILQHSDPAEQLLQELWAVATARATDYYSVVDGTLSIRNTDALDDAQAAAVCSVEKTSNGLRLKLYDKLKALELLGKLLGVSEQGAVRRSDSSSNLLQAIQESTRGELSIHDIPELQQASAAGNDLVEPSESTTI